MVLFFRIITRTFVLGFAYLLACIAAIATLSAGIIGWRISFGEMHGITAEEEFITLIFSSLFGVLAFFNITTAALMPATIAGLITEALSWRSVFIYLLIGGGIALYLLVSSTVYGGDTPPQQDLVITLATGFIAGLTYWLIAGRKAGNWRSKSKNSIISIQSEK